MNTRGSNVPSGLSLLLLLLALAVPAVAEETGSSDPTFDLRLAAAFAAETTEPAPRAATAPGETAEPRAASGPRLTAKRDPLLLPPEPQQTSAAPAPAKKRGFGRWLKKHWYVPVLVGVAIGVVVADDGDDDRLGEDD